MGAAMGTVRLGRSGWWNGKRLSSVQTSRWVSMINRPGFWSRAVNRVRRETMGQVYTKLRSLVLSLGTGLEARPTLRQFSVDGLGLRHIAQRFLAIFRSREVRGAFR